MSLSSSYVFSIGQRFCCSPHIFRRLVSKPYMPFIIVSCNSCIPFVSLFAHFSVSLLRPISVSRPSGDHPFPFPSLCSSSPSSNRTLPSMGKTCLITHFALRSITITATNPQPPPPSPSPSPSQHLAIYRCLCFFRYPFVLVLRCLPSFYLSSSRHGRFLPTSVLMSFIPLLVFSLLMISSAPLSIYRFRLD